MDPHLMMSMEAKTMSLNRMENWRLSRIEEELNNLDISGLNLEGCEDYEYGEASVSGYDSKESTPDIGEVDYRVMKAYIPQSNTVIRDKDDVYSKAMLRANTSTPKDEDNRQKEAVRKISDKYDSLERVKSHISQHSLPAPMAVPQDPRLSLPPHDPYSSHDQATNHMIEQQVSLEEAELALAIQQETALTEHDILQIEMFYRSHRSDVHVCQCMANLYYGTMKTISETSDKWTFVKEGVPVFILDSGESRRKRRLHLVLAEKGTGFTLWKDVVNHLTSYKAPHNNFHTLHLSNDHSKVAGLSFDDTVAAAEFFARFTKLTSDPNDEILNLSKSKKKKDRKKWKLLKKWKAPSKTDISTPCCFTHVTKLDRNEGLSIVVNGPSPCTTPVRSVTQSDSRRNSSSR